jgi:hypothetical protein
LRLNPSLKFLVSDLQYTRFFNLNPLYPQGYPNEPWNGYPLVFIPTVVERARINSRWFRRQHGSAGANVFRSMKAKGRNGLLAYSPPQSMSGMIGRKLVNG